eukprot:5087222-Alexandrium_andersonii.AAC.1
MLRGAARRSRCWQRGRLSRCPARRSVVAPRWRLILFLSNGKAGPALCLVSECNSSVVSGIPSPTL